MLPAQMNMNRDSLGSDHRSLRSNNNNRTVRSGIRIKEMRKVKAAAAAVF